jgi:hypothetical protein
MKESERRKYRGGSFGVPIGTTVPPAAFYAIERIEKVFGITRAAVVRELLLLGLSEYERCGKLPERSASTTNESATRI